VTTLELALTFRASEKNRFYMEVNRPFFFAIWTATNEARSWECAESLKKRKQPRLSLGCFGCHITALLQRREGSLKINFFCGGERLF